MNKIVVCRNFLCHFGDHNNDDHDSKQVIDFMRSNDTHLKSCVSNPYPNIPRVTIEIIID